VKPIIQNQKKIRQARADAAIRPYAEDLEHQPKANAAVSNNRIT
jgi:hypothetical protein